MYQGLDQPELRFKPVEAQSLKNIPGTVHVYEFSDLPAEVVLERQPHNLEALLVLAAAQYELGLERRARATAGMVRAAFPAVDVEGWLESRPHQDRGLVERWRNDLRSVG